VKSLFKILKKTSRYNIKSIKEKVYIGKKVLVELLGVGGRLTVTNRLLRKVLSHSESGSCASR